MVNNQNVLSAQYYIGAECLGTTSGDSAGILINMLGDINGAQNSQGYFARIYFNNGTDVGWVLGTQLLNPNYDPTNNNSLPYITIRLASGYQNFSLNSWIKVGLLINNFDRASLYINEQLKAATIDYTMQRLLNKYGDVSGVTNPGVGIQLLDTAYYRNIKVGDK